MTIVFFFFLPVRREEDFACMCNAERSDAGTGLDLAEGSRELGVVREGRH